MLKRLLSSLLLALPFLAVAQESIQTYSGEMKMSENIFDFYNYNVNLHGEGRYDYYLDAEGHRVKHGRYSFINAMEKRVSPSSKESDMLGALSIRGQFENGCKVGEWHINFETEKYVIHYKDDLLDGDFTVNKRLNPSFTVKCHFKEGHFVGAYEVDADWVIRGQFDDDGLADGVWTVVSVEKSPYSHTYVFSHGRYVRSFMYDDSTGEKVELKEGNPVVIDRDKSLFGPNPFFGKNELKVFYLRDYLANPVFQNAQPPFMYKENKNSVAERSSNHNAYNVPEMEKKLAAENARKLEQILEEGRREAEKARLQAEHPFVTYDGSFEQDVLQAMLPNIPKNRGLKALSGYDGTVEIKVTVNANGKVSAEAARDYSGRSEQAQTVVREAIKAAESLSLSGKWTPGYEGITNNMTFHYYPSGKVTLE